MLIAIGVLSKNFDMKAVPKENDIISIKSIGTLYSTETKYVLFGSDKCFACSVAKKKLRSNQSILLPIYYFNIDNWANGGYSDLICKKFNIKELPCLLKIADGEVIEVVDLKQKLK